MIVVVADTSPLNYLILIEAIDLLPRLYGRIVIPVEVMNELFDDGAPRRVSDWAMKLPEWVEVRSAPLSNDPALSLLDQGEISAILLAQSEAEVLLLIDEAAGRLEASRRESRTLELSAYFGRLPLPGSRIFRPLWPG